MGDMDMTFSTSHRIAVRILSLILITIAIVSIPTLATVSESSRYAPQSLTATSTASSAGTLSVLWGDPYAPARVNTGTGNETLTVTGPVSPRSDLPGYYTYDQARTQTDGELEAQWSTSNETFVVDIYFYQGNSPYNKTTIVPSKNAFAAMYIYFSGELTVNGITSHIQGLAALVAATPGLFSFRGTAPATYVVLYPLTFHGNQYVFRWSKADQTINGIAQPASESILQTVELT